VTIYLIRHAHAGSRSGWGGDDIDRPLSERGEQQAAGILDALRGASIDRIYSSPYRRCLQTVEPLGATCGVKVRTAGPLAEGTAIDDVLSFIADQVPRDSALCTHGDLAPKVIRHLLNRGMQADTGPVSQKGSIWVLDVEKGRVVRGRYLPPVAADDD
jgi:8-oxo-dGTP diphosphatase